MIRDARNPIGEASSRTQDLFGEIQRILAASEEPLTLTRIHASLGPAFVDVTRGELAECLRKLIAASVFHVFPKYRSRHERYWDRSMSVHIACLLRRALQSGPLPWAELRRRLPTYARRQAEPILQEQVAQRRIFRHPPIGPRGREHLGLQPAELKRYLRSRLDLLFQELEPYGFTRNQLNEAARELLSTTDTDAYGTPYEGNYSKEISAFFQEWQSTVPSGVP